MPFETAITAVISALLSAGGVSAIMRARGQNRTDATAALNSGQVAFNQALAQRVKDLEVAIDKQATAMAAQDERYDAMIKTNARLEANTMIKDAQLEIKSDTIARQVNQITALGIEVDQLKRRVAQLEDQADGSKRHER